jgi:hypothetical protein
MNGKKLNTSCHRTIAAAAIGFIVAMVGVDKAWATKLLEVSLQTDKAFYEAGSSYYYPELLFFNAGDEEVTAGKTYYNDATQISLFSNPSGLGRDALLGQEQPLRSYPIHFFFVFLHPGETYGWVWLDDLIDDSNASLAPGKYSLIALEGAAAWAWEDITVDYSNAIADFTIVPEPGTLCLFATAGAACVLRGARRRR